ncbi:MAG: NAD+ synthase [Prochlorothrix sp.]
MNITLAQLNPTIGDLNYNRQQILEAAQTADRQGSQLLLTPELSLCGYPPRDLLLNPSFIQATRCELEQLAQDLPPHIAVLVGTVEANPEADRQGEKPIFNSIALLRSGTIDTIFHKRLLPTYDVFDEDRYFEAGKTDHEAWFKLTATDPKIGVTICEDFWNEESFWGKRNYPQNPIQDLAQQGVDLIVNLSASPYTVGKQKLREQMLGHSARLYNIPILYANQVGGNDDLIFDGHSVVLDRSGSVISRAPGFSVAVQHVTWDSDRRDITPIFSNSCNHSDSNSPRIKTQTVPSPTPQTDASPSSSSNPKTAPQIQPHPAAHPNTAIAPLADCPEAEIWEALVLGVRDYSRKCGFKTVVLGLSGGIDSALVATIAAAALGAPQVLAILMPSPYSSDHSVSDALDLVNNLGIQSHTIAIKPVMQGFDHSLANLFRNREADVTEENLQSRIRGTLLMAVANKFGHLLLSTGNKSEMAVGYCTLYGDMDGGLAAIADVPKTQVYKLCQWINGSGNPRVRQQIAEASYNPVASDQSCAGSTHLDPLQASNLGPENPNSDLDSPLNFLSSTQPLIPPHIITKPPSAELKPDQVDQDSLPDYETLDAILDRLIHQHQSRDQIIQAGFQAEIVEKVWKLVVRSEFKRRQAAPGLKITDRAFGTGWRMPIASRW